MEKTQQNNNNEQTVKRSRGAKSEHSFKKFFKPKGQKAVVDVNKKITDGDKAIKEEVKGSTNVNNEHKKAVTEYSSITHIDKLTKQKNTTRHM